MTDGVMFLLVNTGALLLVGSTVAAEVVFDMLGAGFEWLYVYWSSLEESIERVNDAGHGEGGVGCVGRQCVVGWSLWRSYKWREGTIACV